MPSDSPPDTPRRPWLTRELPLTLAVLAVVALAVYLVPRPASRTPPPEAAAYRQGLAALQRGDFEAAAADFTEALRLNPRNAGALVNRGAARARQGRYAEAVADYDLALAIDPTLAEAWCNRAGALS